MLTNQSLYHEHTVRQAVKHEVGDLLVSHKESGIRRVTMSCDGHWEAWLSSANTIVAWKRKTHCWQTRGSLQGCNLCMCFSMCLRVFLYCPMHVNTLKISKSHTCSSNSLQTLLWAGACEGACILQKSVSAGPVQPLERIIPWKRHHSLRQCD